MSYKDDVNPRSKSKSADKLSEKLRKLMIVCRKNLHYAQELQKRAHNKGVKPRSYAPGNKVWLNSKYIKTKKNRKLEAKFFGPFRVLHPIGKQAYKLELLKRWKIHDVFHVSLLEQDTTRKGRVDENATKLDAGNNEGKEYKVKAIRDSAVYARESAGHLPGSTIWYLGKDIQKKKTPENHTQLFNTLKSSSADSIVIILKNRQQTLRPSTPHHQ